MAITLSVTGETKAKSAEFIDSAKNEFDLIVDACYPNQSIHQNRHLTSLKLFFAKNFGDSNFRPKHQSFLRTIAVTCSPLLDSPQQSPPVKCKTVDTDYLLCCTRVFTRLEGLIKIYRHVSVFWMIYGWVISIIIFFSSDIRVINKNE